MSVRQGTGGYDPRDALALARLALLGVLVGALACPQPDGDADGGADAGPLADPIFPASYAEWTVVRDCRTSIDHDLHGVIVYADEAAVGPYTERVEPFPVGATVLKVEFENDDCTDLLGFTAMRKLAAGTSPDALDWHWQRADAQRVVDQDGAVQRCFMCHAGCAAPDGYDATCAEP